jgi:hypothetical protein
MEINKENSVVTGISTLKVGGNEFVGGTSPARLEKAKPDDYRLKRMKDGELILQAAYFWQQGSEYGHTWKDLVTVNEEDT